MVLATTPPSSYNTPGFTLSHSSPCTGMRRSMRCQQCARLRLALFEPLLEATGFGYTVPRLEVLLGQLVHYFFLGRLMYCMFCNSSSSASSSKYSLLHLLQ